MYIYIYVYIHIHTYMHTYIHVQDELVFLPPETGWGRARGLVEHGVRYPMPTWCLFCNIQFLPSSDPKMEERGGSSIRTRRWNISGIILSSTVGSQPAVVASW